MLAGKKPRLPWAYKEVEYIQTATTSQYINTGVNASQNTRIDLGFLLPVGANWILGGRMSRANRDFSVLGSSEEPQKMIFRRGNSITDIADADSSGSNMRNRKNKFVVTDTQVNATLNGVDYSYSLRAVTFTTPVSVYIFAVNDNGTLTQASISGVRVYYLKMFDGNTPLRDFVPCYRKSDSKAGLYDLVGNTFYTNDGSGDFIVGPNV